MPLLSLVACLTAFNTGVTLSADLHLGIIDFAKCQRSYYKTYTSRSAFSKLRDENSSEVTEMRRKLKSLMEEQQAAGQSQKQGELSADGLREAQERAGQITSLQRDLMERESKANKELEEEASRIQKELTGEIYETASKIGKELGFDLVINVTFGLNGVPAAISCNVPEENNITDRVIQELNRYAPKGWSPPENSED